tara:strand:- start:131 stop:1105 length:975 start_codon:yes stop_codon:yes gene_type:complete
MAGLGVVPVAGDLAKKGGKKLTRVTHGSNDPSFTGEIKKGGIGNIFDGLFASRGDVSDYGGVKQIQYDVDESKIMSMGDADVDYDGAIDFIKKEYPDADEDTINSMYEVIAEDSNVFDMDSNPFENYGFDDLGEASWEGQRLRGKLAKDQGFDAVEMSDEFGASILIPHGSKATQVNQSLPMGDVKFDEIKTLPYKEKAKLASKWKTGQPIKLNYARNTVSSKNYPAGMDFGQKIEPAGRYMNVDFDDKGFNKSIPDWEFGEIEFENPIVLEHKSTNSTGWKKDLSEMFGGSTGKRLTNKLKKAGHDGIITKDADGFNETISIK